MVFMTDLVRSMEIFENTASKNQQRADGAKCVWKCIEGRTKLHFVNESFVLVIYPARILLCGIWRGEGGYHCIVVSIVIDITVCIICV
jgi:hypothetical protein